VRNVDRRRCSGVWQVGHGSPIFFSSIGLTPVLHINAKMLNRTFPRAFEH
jgi:hypothetical protein